MTEPSRPAPAKPGASRIREINDTIRYAMWSVFAVAEPLGDEDRGALATEVEELFTDLASRTSSSAARTTSPGCGPTRTS